MRFLKLKNIQNLEWNVTFFNQKALCLSRSQVHQVHLVIFAVYCLFQSVAEKPKNSVALDHPEKKLITHYQSPAFHFCQSSMCGHPGVNNQVNAGYFPSIRTNLISRSKPDQRYSSSRPFPCSAAKAQAWANTAVAFRPLKINFLIYVSKTDKLLCDKKMKQVFFY